MSFFNATFVHCFWLTLCPGDRVGAIGHRSLRPSGDQHNTVDRGRGASFSTGSLYTPHREGEGGEWGCFMDD